MARDFDLVIQGATGFTGRLAARELAQVAPDGLRWAVAGRDRTRLEAVAAEHGVEAVVADGLDPDAIDALAARSRVVVSCAGPFSRYGTELVSACVRHRTHYADLTGEVPWVYGLIVEHHNQATENGTAIIPSSGFDSVPTDLAVQQMVEELRARDLPVGTIRGFYRIKGGLNGGTLASALHLYEQWPDAMQSPVLRTDTPFPEPGSDRWAAPFLMAGVNEWVVRRSADLLAEAGTGYGSDLRYSEYLSVASRARSKRTARMLGWMHALMLRPFGRRLLSWLGPAPGKGPSMRSIEQGFVHLRLVAGEGERVDHALEWQLPGDPSNAVTVHCLVQTGLALAAGKALRGGVLTPASALGAELRRGVLGADCA